VGLVNTLGESWRRGGTQGMVARVHINIGFWGVYFNQAYDLRYPFKPC